MKKLLILSFVVFALSSCRSGSPRPRQAQEEEPVEYRPLVTDQAVIDSISNSGLSDDDAIMEVPDIPKDKTIKMDANDDEVMKIMTGKGNGDSKE